MILEIKYQHNAKYNLSPLQFFQPKLNIF